MSGLQVRLESKTRLWDIARDILSGIETILVFNKEPVRLNRTQKLHLTRLVRRRLEKEISAFEACGKQARCRTGSVPADESNSSGPPVQTHQIYLLKDNLPNLCIQLEAEIFDHYYSGAQDVLWLSLRAEMNKVIEQSLAPFLYENPHCGACSFCTEANRLSPWSLRKKKAAAPL